MTFIDSIKTCFKKYAVFDGRAVRSEYWWWTLFALLVSTAMSAAGQWSVALSIALFLPSIAVAARRLHDIDRSGWWQLIALVPVIGWLIVLYWMVQPSKEPNRYVEPIGIDTV
ncbi:MAG TPA: DUF805 domain-containing protein [Herbaspirillum sp.]